MRPVEMEALCDHLARSYGATIVGQGGSERDRLFNFRSRALLAFVITPTPLSPWTAKIMSRHWIWLLKRPGRTCASWSR